MEMSHRSKEFIEIAVKAEKDFRDLMGVPTNYKVMFMAGGASLQFSAIPMNLLKDKTKANYFTTGAWSEAAIKEAKKFCTTNEVYPDAGGKYVTVPEPEKWNIDRDAAYFHYCDNETIHGVEFNDFSFETVGEQLLVCDMSSNMCSRPVQWDKYGVVYAGAQKNIGPAGVCVVVIREDLIGHQKPDTPLLMDWKAFATAPTQFHNTPACWPVYVCGLNIAYMKSKGL
jgi:phosphoserine aminotransferase